MKPFRIAVVTTAVTPISHAFVIMRRWLDPLPTDSEYGWPGAKTAIVSMYVMDRGEKDISRDLCRVHSIRDCVSVEDALTGDSGELAVDGVMLIGEHGNFPENELGQKLYPRKELLNSVLGVIDRSGQKIPIFFDKHFSWNVAWAKEMYSALEIRKIPWFGGSSLPLCPKVPETSDFRNTKIREVVITTWGELEPYLFHALECLESVVDQRSSTQSGIASITAWRGDESWRAMDNKFFPMDLLKSAVAVVGTDAVAGFQRWRSNREHSAEIFQIQYKDGLRATVVNLNGILRKWAFACRLDDSEQTVASTFLAGGADLGFPHFARLAGMIQEFFLTGRSPVPHSRLYVTTIACAFCMQALAQPGSPLDNSEIVVPTFE
jgi:hypothetical protein